MNLLSYAALNDVNVAVVIVQLSVQFKESKAMHGSCVQLGILNLV